MAPVTDPRFDGARIPDPGFSGDDGSADPELRAAIAAGDSGAVLARLGAARVLVPVVAMLGEVEYDDAGLAHDKTSDMAAVLLQTPGGDRALLAFTGTDALHAWNPDARPVPVTGEVAAKSAIQEEAGALVLDVAGPVMFVADGDDLEAIARGWRLVDVDGRLGWMTS